MFNLENVAAAKPVAPWLGGKSRLAALIIRKIEVIPHTTYAEPFVGMGGVFLRRSRRPKSEVINDLNGEIINLFRILQRHYPQFMDCLKFQITSRREFQRLRATDPATLTDLERAARFLYLQRTSFGGKVDGVFGVSPDRAARFDLNTLGPLLDAAYERLSGVVFENLDWSEFIQRYDHKDALFYLDPPYFGNENDYGDGFAPDAFEAMAALLGSIKGQFLLSINDRTEIRDIFHGFHLEPLKVTYSVAQGAISDRASELLISREPVVEGLL